MGEGDGCEERVESISRTKISVKLLIQLVREILNLSGKCQGKVMEMSEISVCGNHIPF